MGIPNPYYLDFGFFLAGLQDNERNSPSVLFVLPSFDWAHRTKSIWSNDFLLRPATPSHLTVGLAAMNHEVQSVISCNPQLWIAHWHWRQLVRLPWGEARCRKLAWKVLRKLCRPGLSSPGHITPGVQRLVFDLFFFKAKIFWYILYLYNLLQSYTDRFWCSMILYIWYIYIYIYLLSYCIV